MKHSLTPARLRRFFTAVIGLALTASALNAQDYRDRRPTREVSRNFSEMADLIAEGIEAAHDWRFSYALYKFKAARMRLDVVRSSREKSQLAETLDATIMKLRDYSLSSREKEDLVADCGEIALERLKRLEDCERGWGRPDDDRDHQRLPRNLDEAIRTLNRASELALQGRYEEVLEYLDAVQKLINRYGFDRELNRAGELVRSTEDSLRDNHSSDSEKSRAVQNLARSFSNIVKRSDTFRREHGIDYRGAVTVPLGRSDLFSKSRYETRVIAVPTSVGSIRALKVIARDDSVNISEIVVELENGTRLSLGGDLLLSENDSSIVDIDMRGRMVKSVQVTAVSAVLWGTKGRVELQGVR